MKLPEDRSNMFCGRGSANDMDSWILNHLTSVEGFM